MKKPSKTQAKSMDNRHAFRAKWHDYDSGIYFVTICSHDKRHIFGHISNAEMNLSEIGRIVADCLHRIPCHFPKTEILNKVIMPNHIHIILSVGARYIAPAANIGCLKHSKYGDKCEYFHHNSQLANIIGTFKAAVTREYHRQMRARCIAPLPRIWQRLYHEHIIQDQYSYENIMNYIDNNPVNWKNDCFYDK